MKILFVISETGLGHQLVAQALIEEVKHLMGKDFEYKIIDLLKMSKLFLAKDFPALQMKMSQGGLWLWVYNIFFHLTNSPLGLIIFTLPLRIHLLLKAQKLRAYFKQEQPDLVININAYTNVIMQWSVLNSLHTFKYVNFISDLTNIHYAWMMGNHDLCFLPTYEAYHKAKKYNVKNLRMMGYPIKRAYVRIRHDTFRARSLLLKILIFGRNRDKTIDTITTLIDAFDSIKITVICGKNSNLQKSLERQFPNIHVLGFVNHVPQLMKQHTIVITKAGPGVMMEAIFLRKILIVTHYIGIHEKANIDFMTCHTYGYYCPANRQLTETITAVWENTKKKVQDTFHHQYHTRSIAKAILQLVRS